jgi:hypothetical protein
VADPAAVPFPLPYPASLLLHLIAFWALS